MVVIGGAVVGVFLSQEEAERAYNAIRGIAAPAPSSPGVTLDCSQGQGAPVNGGCWCCIDGVWATDPLYCADPAWARRCGNAGGGGSGGTQPQPGAPTSPGSGPTIPGGSAPSAPAPTLGELLDRAAARLGVGRGALVAAGAIVAAAVVLR